MSSELARAASPAPRPPWSPWRCVVLLLSAALLGHPSVHAQEPKIVAHRGASQDAPENTLPAFELAWQQGADAIEGDFHLTKDGHVVCIHDEETGRVAEANLVVHRATLEELRRLDVGLHRGEAFKGTTIPTIAEVLAGVPPQKAIYIEVKCGPEIITPLLRDLEASGLAPGQIKVMSFRKDVIAAIKAAAPQYEAVWLSNFQRDESGGTKPSLESVLATLRETGADALGAADRIPESFVEAIEKQGFPWHVWTVNDPATARRMKAWGARSIITDAPRVIRNALGGPGAGREAAVAPRDPAPGDRAPFVGPMLGAVDHRSARIWFRTGAGESVTLVVRDGRGREIFEQQQTANSDNDFCVVWTIDELAADTPYRYAIKSGAGGETFAEAEFRTAPPPDAPSKTVMAFGSCASNEFPAVWERMAQEGADVVFLIGDTPYIDSSDLAVNRRKHREFLAQPGLRDLMRSRPVLGTWDDHDFGGNDTDGTNVDRDTIRRVFMEYRAHQSFGEKDEGIYTSFRRGPVEVFLIDARYFSQTEPSPVDPSKPTLLGRRQWEWLKNSLAASTATFKVLVTGLVWHDKPNQEKDDWENYAHEREALFRFIGERKIPGVVLVSGDVHVSLLLEHPTEKTAGYPIFELVSSPLNATVHGNLVPASDGRLKWSAVEPNVFLRLEADSTGGQPLLKASWVRMDGRLLHERQW
jgi:alkaline phosphatase D